ncbi:family 16 glycosylhydrolase [Phycisphaerales bacterium AB-hyl4]|uniref:Family 16 glycosylhydrolase n=1 Tax=Natronomicrosphaera hydrolytica TaxID=3242702 RepID=A0ABV4U9Z4_9BACT
MQPMFICLFVGLVLGAFANVTFAREIEFAGRNWTVRSGYGGPGPNNWSASTESVWVDDQGHLHLQLRRVGSMWYAAEVVSTETFGYGEYRFQLASDVEQLDPNVTLGLFTYLDDENEIDIEFARWGNANNPAGNYVTQPAATPGNTETFDLNLTGNHSTHRFNWTPDAIEWQSHHGHYGSNPPASHLIHEWTYTGSDIPVPSGERVHMNLWLFQGNAPATNDSIEIVITNFEFVPIPEPTSLVAMLGGAISLVMRRRTS